MRDQRGTQWSFLFCALLLLVVCEGFNIDREAVQVERRGYRDADDPRNLFAAMYGGVYKREDPNIPRLTPEQYQYLKTLVHKRGLRDPYDPRNLFHSVYGGVWRK
eukprot:TRINITY_DN21387_c0_g1_i1.p1 TRINITY_DN21387_c0_g1~~TRINITY_DN21387_c0_g1_i1.p1  ORF type:complete len:105 (-),score=20.34 TRINITY_DN21387_c0_g1_i1:158-472(-)